jgi:hypothetical protein
MLNLIIHSTSIIFHVISSGLCPLLLHIDSGIGVNLCLMRTLDPLSFSFGHTSILSMKRILEIPLNRFVLLEGFHL